LGPNSPSGGIAGAAILRCVVETAGRVSPASVQLIMATDVQVAMAVREGLPRMEFTPAEIDGRKGSEIVQMPFSFAMHR
jgi:hypothetical protein